jgi:phosphoribosylamine---glycine ligase
MKVLVVGGGGREHALVWKIARSPEVSRVYCAPGNAGIAGLAEIVALKADDLEGLAALAQKERIDLTVVGPEDPLTKGIVDLFESKGLPIFGPSRAAAEIEGSKVFSKRLFEKYRIPSARYEVFDDPEAALTRIRGEALPLVVKADGLAAGKGVFVCKTPEEALQAVDEIMVRKAFGEAGRRIVIEECLSGEEASILAFTDGKTVLPMASAQDHKAIFDGDRGPNTGGMGAYSPAPVVTQRVLDRVMDEILHPVVEAMAAEGRLFRGVLYAGLMISDGSPRVLEFNARFGDPEAQPVLMRMKGDIVPVLQACARGDLSGCKLDWDDRAAVCVVMASGGYPGDYEKGKVIRGIDEASAMKDVVVFHAGTARRDGAILTNGGRVLGVTSLGNGVEEAIGRAYEAAGRISWEGAQYRTDIGRKALLKRP